MQNSLVLERLNVAHTSIISKQSKALIFSCMFYKVKIRLGNAVLVWIPNLNQLHYSIEEVKLRIVPHTVLFEETKMALVSKWRQNGYTAVAK